MTTRERLVAALNFETPDKTPLSFYSWMADDFLSDDWKRLYDLGLGICHHCEMIQNIEHGVEYRTQTHKKGADILKIEEKVTPAGTIRMITTNGWVTEHWIKTPQDYRIMQWIAEHTEIHLDQERFERETEMVGENGVVVILASRTPLMRINVDWAGTEQFCLDLALHIPELHELYEAQLKLFLKETELLARAPGRYIKWLENLTIGVIGPQRYHDLMMPVYQKAVPVLEQAGKRVMVHYDGALSVIRDQIATAPFHMIESLTEPPEGDMLYDECRQAWPDKVFWANINVDHYFRPEPELRRAVIDKRQRAGKTGFAVEISEDLPSNWKQSVPIVLKTLEELD